MADPSSVGCLAAWGSVCSWSLAGRASFILRHRTKLDDDECPTKPPGNPHGSLTLKYRKAGPASETIDFFGLYRRGAQARLKIIRGAPHKEETPLRGFAKTPLSNQPDGRMHECAGQTAILGQRYARASRGANRRAEDR
jgi:hypothetical protein